MKNPGKNHFSTLIERKFRMPWRWGIISFPEGQIKWDCIKKLISYLLKRYENTVVSIKYMKNLSSYYISPSLFAIN